MPRAGFVKIVLNQIREPILLIKDVLCLSFIGNMRYFAYCKPNNITAMVGALVFKVIEIANATKKHYFR
jgi:hypothetical protein